MAGQKIDGVSLVPLLKGENLPERSLFWHYPHYGNQGGAPGAAIRRGDWKLIEWMEDGRMELYNLANDLSEQHNLAAQEPERVQELTRQLRAWQTEVGAKSPIHNPNYKANLPDGRAAKRPASN